MRDFPLRSHVWLVATLFPLLERLLPLRGLLWLAERPGGWTPYRGVAAERIIALIAHRLRNPYYMRRRRCFRQGMMQFHFLRLAGVPVVMHFGVLGPATSGQRLHAHCWVNIDGHDVHPPTGNVAVVLTRSYQPNPA
jgi:hypothetical protein